MNPVEVSQLHAPIPHYRGNFGSLPWAAHKLQATKPSWASQNIPASRGEAASWSLIPPAMWHFLHSSTWGLLGGVYKCKFLYHFLPVKHWIGPSQCGTAMLRCMAHSLTFPNWSLTSLSIWQGKGCIISTATATPGLQIGHQFCCKIQDSHSTVWLKWHGPAHIFSRRE